jgi:hypothetical protein
MVQYDRLDWIELAYQTHLTHSAPEHDQHRLSPREEGSYVSCLILLIRPSICPIDEPHLMLLVLANNKMMAPLGSIDVWRVLARIVLEMLF